MCNGFLGTEPAEYEQLPTVGRTGEGSFGTPRIVEIERGDIGPGSRPGNSEDGVLLEATTVELGFTDITKRYLETGAFDGVVF